MLREAHGVRPAGRRFRPSRTAPKGEQTPRTAPNASRGSTSGQRALPLELASFGKHDHMSTARTSKSASTSKGIVVGEGEEVDPGLVITIESGILIVPDVARIVKIRAICQFQKMALVMKTETEGEDILVRVGDRG